MSRCPSPAFNCVVVSTVVITSARVIAHPRHTPPCALPSCACVHAVGWRASSENRQTPTRTRGNTRPRPARAARVRRTLHIPSVPCESPSFVSPGTLLPWRPQYCSAVGWARSGCYETVLRRPPSFSAWVSQPSGLFFGMACDGPWERPSHFSHPNSQVRNPAHRRASHGGSGCLLPGWKVSWL